MTTKALTTEKPTIDIKATTITPMLKTEALQVVDKINLNVSQAGVLLLEFRRRRGWAALGYDSFTIACEKEFNEIYGKRAQIYVLMQQAEVNESLTESSTIVDAEPIKLKVAQTRALAGVAPENRAAVLQKAGWVNATAAQIKAAAADAPKADAGSRGSGGGGGGTPKVTKSNPKASAAKLEAAYVRIGKIAGPKVLKAVRDGIMKNVTPKEALLWAALKDGQMADIEELVVTKRWKPSAAWKLVNKSTTVETRIQELIHLAIAGGGKWEGDFSGFNVKVTAIKRR